MWDVFISYSSDDRDAVAGPLAEELARRGYRVWYDRFVLQPGDDLQRAVNEGLASCRYAVVVLSHSFFAKEWTRRELTGLLALEEDRRKRVVPVWHGLSQQEVARYDSIVAGRVALSTEDGLNTVVEQIVRVLGEPGSGGDGAGDDAASAPVPRRGSTQVIPNVWFTPRRFRFYSIMNPDVGTLFVHDDHVVYRGERGDVRLEGITDVRHTKMPGGINNCWVEVRHRGGDGEAAAYFSDATQLGIGSLLGGSEEILRALLRFSPAYS